MKALLLFLALCIRLSTSGYCQGEQLLPYYRHFDAYDGLPSNETFFIYQDRENYIWVCTNNGVSKFDGIKFKNYSMQEGLCFNVVFGCGEDEYGDLWFYSFTGELSKYDRRRDRFECPAFNDSLSEFLKGQVIKGISFDGDTIYLTTAGFCYKVFPSIASGTQIEKIVLPYNTITIHIPRKGRLITMYNLRPRKKTFTLLITGIITDTIQNVPLKGKIELPFAGAYKWGKYYVLFGENMIEYSPERPLNVVKMPFFCSPGIKTSHEGLICGSYYKGLWLIRKERDSIAFEQLLNGVSISDAMQDKQGGIWGSSQENGIFYLPALSVLTGHKIRDAANEDINAIYRLKDKVFYTTYMGDLNVLYNEDGKIYKKHLYNAGERIHFYGYRNNRLLIRMNTAVYSFHILNGNLKKLRIGEYDDPCLLGQTTIITTTDPNTKKLILKICRDGVAKQLWVPGKWDHGKIRNTAITATGKILIGTIFDLFAFDTSANTLCSIGKSNGYDRLNVTHILPSGTDSAVIATSHGIFLIAGNRIIKQITTADGLSSNSVSYILSDKDDFFAATSRGIDHIKNLLNASKPDISSVTYFSGLNICPVSHLTLLNDFLIAGTDNGIFVFKNRHTVADINTVPKITALHVNDLPIEGPFHNKISLKHNQNSLSIEFASMNFRNSMHNRFRYRLIENHDTAWHYTDIDRVSFSSVSVGKYLFELQVMNPNGKWNPKGALLAITINPPFWQEWWFIFFILCAVTMGIYSLFHIRLRQIRQVTELRNKLSETKFQALGMQLNPHFVFNALNSVSSHMAHNDAKTTLKFLGKFARLMRAIFRNSQHAVIPLEDELNALRMYLELELIRLNHKFKYAIAIEDDVDVYECRIPALLLQPIVENAIWHGLAPSEIPGKLCIHIKKEADSLKIEIIDNGIGREKAATIKSRQKKEKHSLDIIGERLALLGSHLGEDVSLVIDDYNGNETCGTKVTILIPYFINNVINQP